MGPRPPARPKPFHVEHRQLPGGTRYQCRPDDRKALEQIAEVLGNLPRADLEGGVPGVINVIHRLRGVLIQIIGRLEVISDRPIALSRRSPVANRPKTDPHAIVEAIFGKSRTKERRINVSMIAGPKGRSVKVVRKNGATAQMELGL